MNEMLPLCQCGCGEPVKQPGNKFLKGHATRRTAIRTNTTSQKSGDDMTLHQNLELAQQLIGKTLRGSKDNHTINIITVGPVQIQGGQPQNSFTLQESLSELFKRARASGELPNNDVEARIVWLSLCEKAT